MALRRFLQPLVRLEYRFVQQLAPAGSLVASSADRQQPSTAAWPCTSYSTSAEGKQQQDKQQESTASQQQPVSAAPAPATTTDPGTTAAARLSQQEEEWTEVVGEKSGQTYYWNQSTGETTDLGGPRPKTRFRDQSWQQASSSGTPLQEGFREPPGRDRTYTYSMLGILIGVSAGWFTQYLH